jgi:putative ATP-dependent endonuclease of the OLD family
MYIEKLTIKKFRSINHLDIIFNKGVNIIIGENNAGKTAVIDALRICLSIGRQYRDIGIRNDEDFYIDTHIISDILEPIEFDLYFKIEHQDDRSFFNSLVWQNPDESTDQNLQMHFKYELEKDARGNSKLKWDIWGGHNNPIDIKESQLIYYSYLEPLRNAEQELKPYANNNKISSLFREMTKYNKIVEGESKQVNLTSDKKNELSQALEDVVKNDDWTSLIVTGQEFINEHLEKADVRKKGSKVHLKLLEYKYENIIKGLITRKPVYSDELISKNPNQQKFLILAKMD